RARKRLRMLRRAAGAARDWDVFLAGLTERAQRLQKARPGADFLRGYALGQRVAAQIQLDGDGSPILEKFGELLSKTTEAVREPHAPNKQDQADTLIELARPHLMQWLHELNAAATGDLNDYKHLHQVRIIGKRLRYAMEVFATCFPAEFRE